MSIISPVKKIQKSIKEIRNRRSKRVRMSIKGTSKFPRLSVFRSSRYIYAQIIDDAKGCTLASAKGILKEADRVGEDVAKKALERNIKNAVFDRGSFAYHGHVKELAEGARKAGLIF